MKTKHRKAARAKQDRKASAYAPYALEAKREFEKQRLQHIAETGEHIPAWGKLTEAQRDYLAAAARDGDKNQQEKTIKLSKPITQAEYDKLEISVTLTMERLNFGTGTLADYKGIRLVCFIAYCCAKFVEDPQGREACEEVAKEAIDAVLLLRQRYRATGSLLFNGAGRNSVNNAIDLYLQYIKNNNRIQIRDAQREAWELIEQEEAKFFTTTEGGAK